MPKPTACVLTAGRTSTGYYLSVQGHGTMKESPAAHEFVVSSLENGAESLVIDLTRCDYLDSTFLGCLMELHKRFNRDKVSHPVPRLTVAADAAKVQALLHPSRLELILKIVPTAPECVGDCVPLALITTDKTAFSKHVMECHRRLAEIDGPNKTKFAMIADHMASELQKNASAS